MFEVFASPSGLSGLEVRETIQAYRLRAVVAVQAVFLVCAAVTLVLYSPSKATVFWACLASCLVSLASLFLARTRRLSPAVWVLCLQLLAMGVGLALLGRGTYDITTLILPAGLMAMAIVEKPWPVAAFAVVNVLSAVGIAWATAGGLVEIPPAGILGSDLILDGVGLVVIVGFVACLSVYLSHVLASLLGVLSDRSLELERRVEARTADLTRANSELQAALGSLQRTRDELVRHERLVGLGRLVSGVAHELNTPIGNSLLAATSLQEYLGKVPRAQWPRLTGDPDLLAFLDHSSTALELLVRALGRSADLVARFKRISVDPVLDKRQSFSLAALVTEEVGLCRMDGPPVAWTADLAVDPGLVCQSYPGALREILSNLVRNALVHGFRDRSSGRVAIAAGAPEPGLVVLTVSDDGRGIAPGHRDRIFDPFFTTDQGKSLGLGLTLSWNLAVAVLGGTLTLAPDGGPGARFVLTFPQEAPHLEAPAP